ncbi:FixH family protein [Halobacillus sp. BBL2006]|uniref:FixH family protein n=1 Tax=Halobacillus sp. BBL2006 TaxID=1543706 RepID=UPI000543915B|nr:FixH family protein [Halobacillus sp. BBL2006]KHE69049.1 hypothetical protein LD39_13505 [Halobacillus sp. BBL2006]
MKRLTATILFIFLILFLAACGSSDQEQGAAQEDESSAESLTPPEVEVQFKEQPLPVNEETVIQAVVIQGDEKVKDAEYVEFEIWNDADGEDSSEKVKASHTKDGVYEAAYTFEKAGTYQVIAHTQVGDLHTMPQKEVTVGKEKDQAAKEDTTGEDSSHDSGESDGYSHGNKEFMVHLMTDQIFKTGEESTLTAHVSQMESPFEDAMVRFEISSDQMERHAFIDAEEFEPGEYKATYTFPSAGDYTINVHYEKPDKEIHGHKEETIEVIK